LVLERVYFKLTSDEIPDQWIEMYCSNKYRFSNLSAYETAGLPICGTAIGVLSQTTRFGEVYNLA
jgi:hypothetical protein